MKNIFAYALLIAETFMNTLYIVFYDNNVQDTDLSLYIFVYAFLKQRH